MTATQADDYPSRTITVIVPYPAGGPSDVVARIVADSMSRVLKQTIIIENVGGAGGTLGTARVAAAAPDGYTLLAASMGSHVAAPALTPNLRYDSTKDFEPIGLTSNAPVAVVARKDFAAKDLKEFLAQVKAQGDNVKQAHGGVGSSSHMACLLFTAQFGLKPKLVPYRGTGPALNDLIGDHVDFFCEQVVSVAPAVNGNNDQGLCGVGQYALAGLAGCADGQASRPGRIQAQHLERHVRAERNAERHRRQACPRARPGARRSGARQAARRARRHRSGQGGARPGASRQPAQGRHCASGSDPAGRGGRRQMQRVIPKATSD